MFDCGPDPDTTCAVYDKTPGSNQKKIILVVRPAYTVGKVIGDVAIQFGYTSFDLVFQPLSKSFESVYLNDCQEALIHDLPGFITDMRNHLVLLPAGQWNGDTKQRYSITEGHYCRRTLDKSASPSIAYNSATSYNSHSNNNSSSDIWTDDFGSMPCTLTTATNTTSMAHSVLHLASITHGDPDLLLDDDLALGASASPTETEPMSTIGPGMGNQSPTNSSLDVKIDPTQEARPEIISDRGFSTNEMRLWGDSMQSSAAICAAAAAAAAPAETNTYVGLVNQAMTCYLNSLLQALYMTPEFRNALYRWEFDNDAEHKNIPYQLQKLFLNLQTSKKSAVETTDLTRSFGWDSTEAWQQHDIQELCRVMFDALEHKFRNTKQAKLISNLYEGKMIDYVKCLECNTEKTREDTFLDIPLPVRPFGSASAYGSIEEALRAFVQPETLDGNNQYFCEKCNKKCDAHKGLKFKNFPYILTLHLKRFDFDYTTMHRIKLNDKVTFPQTLNLNSFVNPSEEEPIDNDSAASAAVTPSANHSAVNGYMINAASSSNGNTDDCSTTDSGSAMEEDACSSIPTTACSSQHENDMQDDDEGIDISSSTDARTVASEGDQQMRAGDIASGPYAYELFAIMIHSGSASGGHYYAYIKEFDNNEWYCFNDQTVSSITEEDIEKSFGGGPSKAYYTSAYSSSTNAYMLMYRQIDGKRNERAMQTPNFPKHISKLLPQLQSSSEGETRRHHSSSRYALAELTLPDLIKQRVHFYNPLLKKMKVTRVYVARHFTTSAVLESAYMMLNVRTFAPMSHCRLVAYEASSEQILHSFEDVGESALQNLHEEFNGTVDFLLEYRVDGQKFEEYKPGGATWFVYMVNMNTMEMDGQYLVYSEAHEKSDVLKHSIAVRLYVKEDELLLATLANKRAFVAYDPAPTEEAEEKLQTMARLQFRSLTYFFISVPPTDAESLKVLGIPSLDTQIPPDIEVSGDEVDAVLMNTAACGLEESNTTPTNGCLSAGDYSRREMGSLPAMAGQESNSEDSSLSDGDRTLVESINNRGGGDSQFSSNSHSPQLSSPEDEPNTQDAAMSRITAFFSSSLRPTYRDDVSALSHQQAKPLFFHAIKIDLHSIEDVDVLAPPPTSSCHSDAEAETLPKNSETTYKIIVDSHMRIEAFKRHLEVLIRVPANYFTITHKHDANDSINSTQSLVFLSEGETLIIQLGKILQENEYKAKIFFMKLSEIDDDTGKLPYVCEWICRIGMTIGEAKRALVEQLHRIDAKYETLTMDNCRMWTKGGRNPIKILSNDEVLGSDVRYLSVACEFIVQECEEGVPTETSDESLTIFIREWHPDTLELGKFQEITLEKHTEIRQAIAEVSKIPAEDISYSKLNSFFPCTNLSLLNINSMSWYSLSATMENYPLKTTLNGNIYFYKDVTKTPKELSVDERRELNAKERVRLERLDCSSTSFYSPRRERALKIHLDSSPQSKTSSAMMTSSSKTND